MSSSSNNSQEKMDALDLIINVLREHEEILGELTNRLKDAVSELSEVKSKVSGFEESITEVLPSKKEKTEVLPSKKEKKVPLVQYNKWIDFKIRSKDVSLVAFETKERMFTINSVSDQSANKYSENLPRINFRLKEEDKQFRIDKIIMGDPNDLDLLFQKQLRCGLKASVKSSKLDLSDKEHMVQLVYDIDSDNTKRWISKELGIPKERVVEGKITSF